MIQLLLHLSNRFYLFPTLHLQQIPDAEPDAVPTPYAPLCFVSPSCFPSAHFRYQYRFLNCANVPFPQLLLPQVSCCILLRELFRCDAAVELAGIVSAA